MCQMFSSNNVRLLAYIFTSDESNRVYWFETIWRNLAHLTDLHSGLIGTHQASIFYIDCNGEILKKKIKSLPFVKTINGGFLTKISNILHLINQIIAHFMLNLKLPVISNFQSKADHSTH